MFCGLNWEEICEVKDILLLLYLLLEDKVYIICIKPVLRHLCNTASPTWAKLWLRRSLAEVEFGVNLPN